MLIERDYLVYVIPRDALRDGIEIHQFIDRLTHAKLDDQVLSVPLAEIALDRILKVHQRSNEWPQISTTLGRGFIKLSMVISTDRSGYLRDFEHLYSVAFDIADIVHGIVFDNECEKAVLATQASDACLLACELLELLTDRDEHP